MAFFKETKKQVELINFTSKADTEETKKLLDKLVVLKFNDAPGINMGFEDPK